MKYKSKILTIIPSLYGGGAEKSVSDLSFDLSKAYDHEILIYNSKKNKYDYSGRLTELKIKRSNFGFFKVFRQFIILFRIYLLKKKINPKVTVSHMLLPNLQNIITRHNEKIICVIRGEWSVKSGKGRFIDFFVKKLYSKADLLISVSNHIKDVFDDYHKLKIPHIVINNGIYFNQIILKSEELIPINLPKNYIVCVAGFRPVKNHLDLLKAIQKYLIDNDISLVLVGDGELRRDIEKLILELKLSKNVFLTGNLKNPYPIIKNAQLSLLVSKSESFSLVVLESLSLGVPVIATDCGGPKELLTSNSEQINEYPYITECGILIENSKSLSNNQLIKSLDYLLDNNILMNRMSISAVNQSKKFDVNNTANLYIKAIEDLFK
jgi:glycosyltransferase involved in cell wall biosynthesis